MSLPDPVDRGAGAERRCPRCGQLVGGGDRARLPYHLRNECQGGGQ